MPLEIAHRTRPAMGLEPPERRLGPLIGALSRAGPVNLAAALRHHARDPARPLTTLGITCV